MQKAIRVLHVVTYMGRGGLETMIMNYYRHMDRSKVQFDFLTHRDFRADYDDEIEALGGRIYHLPRLVPWSRSYRQALESFFDEHPEYRIVHVHQDCLSSVILRAAKSRGIPVRIAHSHSSSQDKNLKYIIKLFYKQFIPRYATDLFACGRDAGDWMFGKADYRIVNNAIDAAGYRYCAQRSKTMRRSLGIPADALVVGHVGRFSYPKNHGYLIDIFAAIHRKAPDAYLLLVGDGQSRKMIQEKVDALHISDRVIFTGLRPDVADLMQAMDAFVFPSLYEGLPLTLVEAQAAGLPCLISDHVPLDCKLTPLVHQLALEDAPDVWADKVLALAQSARADTYKAICESGFDILENARWLQSEYWARWHDCDGKGE